MSLNPPLKPKAKLENLVVQDFSDEILIYNLENNKAYSLNKTLTLVWQNCDGKKDVQQIARELEKKLNQSVPIELIWLALDSLQKQDLIKTEEIELPALNANNRRQMLKKIALATLVSLPVMSILTAPLATHAASGIPAVCQTCSKKKDSCNNLCLNVIGTCYDNSGCGNGQPISNITCQQCKIGVVFTGGVDTGSWEA
jgi:hypothetical protein